ncbi:MAG TPA: phospholipase D-like domain-containing protein [Burkholderiales bacterium]|nr:phospholipase D-like domain-containing protein [Burkholderiales bacterium]
MTGDLLARHWLTLHGFVVLLGLAIYVIGSRTLQQRRRPSAAIAWVIGLIVLPYLALPLYLLFGNRKLVDSRQPGAPRPRALPLAEGAAGPEAQLRELAAAMALPAAAPYSNLNVHADGAEALQALYALIDGATRTLDVCTFVFGKDDVGAEIARRLAQRARDGLRVRLLVDGIGAYLPGFPNFRRLTDAGVETALFVPPLRSSLRGRTNLRNHRKMAIADGEWLWCGGRNLAGEYFRDEGAHSPWIDLSFDLRGPLALQAQRRFAQDWAFASGGQHAAQDEASTGGAGAPLGQLIASGPDQADDTVYTLLVAGFFAARRRILAVTPYFVPNETFSMALSLAARRGVAVDLVMPAKSNHLLADMARHRALRDVATAGARVWFLPRMIHAKGVVIDDHLALVGSANLDERSLFLNYELMVAFYAPHDIGRFARWIEQQRDAAAAYEPRAPGLARDVAEGLLLWLAFQL